MGYAQELPATLFCFSQVALVLLFLLTKWADTRLAEFSWAVQGMVWWTLVQASALEILSFRLMCMGACALNSVVNLLVVCLQCMWVQH